MQRRTQLAGVATMPARPFRRAPAIPRDPGLATLPVGGGVCDDRASAGGGGAGDFVGRVEYVLDGCRLRPAEREVRRHGVLVPMPRLSFDCVVYLIEQRDRAIGRDELVAAVWGQTEVSEGHLNQVIARARRMLGDTAQMQQTIRTVHGFGYRWVGAVQVVENPDAVDGAAGSGGGAAAGEGGAVESAPRDEVRPPAGVSVMDVARAADVPTGADITAAATAADPAIDDATPSSAATARHLASSATRWRWLALSILAIAVLAVGIWLVRTPSDADPAVAAFVPAQTDRALIVLPVDVDGPKDASWVSLGAMDLIATRLRDAELRVPPSETVLAALDDLPSPLAAADTARVADTLGGGVFVRSNATHDADGWTVRLRLQDNTAEPRQAEARHADVIQAARAATDLLLVALGRKPQPPGPADGALQTRLQQAQAAVLTNQLDLARSILADVPRTADVAADIDLRLADIDFRAGRMDAADKTVATLLADAGVLANETLHGRVLLLRGNIAFRRSAFEDAARDLDAAVAALQAPSAALDLCDALTRRALTRFSIDDYDGALSDYSRARLLAEQAGDRLRLTHVEAGFGRVQLERRRLDLALPYLDAAIAQYEAFGVVERVIVLNHVLSDTYAELLRWSDVRRLNDRIVALQERISDPGLRLVIANRRVRLLAATGQLAEATRIAADARGKYASLRPEVARYLHDLEAELAWAQGDHAAMRASTEAALQHWPRDPSFDRYAYLVLLRQRALIALGEARPETIASWIPAATGPELSPIFLVARAEWADARDDAAAAGADYQQAMQVAESRGTPALVVLVAQSFADWLLRHGDVDRAGELAGRVAVFSTEDFDAARLRVRVLHAVGRRDTWAEALVQAQALAGERVLPAELVTAPVASGD